MSPETMVQIRMLLPASSEYLVAIGRILRVSPRGEITVVFLQMPPLGQDRLSAFCVDLHASRTAGPIIIMEGAYAPISGRLIGRAG